MQEKLFPVFGIVLLMFGEEESASSDVAGCTDNVAEFIAGDVGFKATGVEYEILFELSGANDDRFCWKKGE
mgnify:FL=1|jgi:hypothetical protein